MRSPANDSAVRRRPLFVPGGLAVLALIGGLLFGSTFALPVALLGVAAALVLLRKAPGQAALGVGLNVAAFLVLYLISILIGT